VAIAWRAGALLRDLEFVQFHPTALTREGADRFLVVTVRGEGAHLVDSQGRFAFDYHSELGNYRQSRHLQPFTHHS